MAKWGTLKDKVIIITGMTQNIGKDIYQEFAAEGATVIGCGRSAEKGEKVCAEVIANGGKAEFYHVDVCDEDGVKAMIEAVAAKYGRIDGLVNNAAAYGPYGAIPTTDLTAADMRVSFDTCVIGTFLMTKYVGKEMVKAQSGRIVDILSIFGFKATPVMTPYHVSKAALLMLMKQDALTYGKKGIRVNGVAPGSIIGAESWPGYVSYYGVNTVEEAKEVHKKNVVNSNTLGRWGEPEEIAAAVRFFLAEDDFCNGAVINCDGGSYIM